MFSVGSPGFARPSGAFPAFAVSAQKHAKTRMPAYFSFSLKMAQKGSKKRKKAQKGSKRRSKRLFEPARCRQCARRGCSSLLRCRLCVRRGCSKGLSLSTLRSASLDSALLCYVHGYARVRTSIYIYRSKGVPLRYISAQAHDGWGPGKFPEFFRRRRRLPPQGGGASPPHTPHVGSAATAASSI